MWKLLRTNAATGEISDEEAQVVADQIDMYAERSCQGEFPDSGREDVLFKVLGEEHGGRVRGVGLGVTITDYFRSLANPKQTRDELNELKLMVNQLTQEVVQLKQQNGTTSTTPMSADYVKEVSPSTNTNSFTNIPEGISACELALSDPTYRVVATGKLHNFKHCSRIIHGKPLLPEQVRVSIEYVLEKEAILPIPVEEAYTVNEALGTHVAWPRHLIVPDGKTSPLLKERRQEVTTILQQEKSPEPMKNSKKLYTATSLQSKKLTPISKNKGQEVASSCQAKKTSVSLEEKAKYEEKITQSSATDHSILVPQGVTTCKLALSDPTYRFVAIGKIHNIPDRLRVLHGKSLLHDQVRVSIEYALENEALLPIPIEDEAYTVNEALGTHVAWPKHLVVFYSKTTKTTKDSRKLDKTPLQAKKISTSLQEKTKSKTLQRKIPTNISRNSQDHENINPDILPRELRAVYMFVYRMGKDEQIMLSIEKSVVNRSRRIFIGQDEFFQLLGQQEIGACHMSAYIMLLYRQCHISGKLDIYGFLCPTSISLVIQSKHEDQIKENRVERSRYIVDALNYKASEGKVFLAPYNAGHHWVLCVIDPFADVVYYMDPLGDKDRTIGDDLRSVVDTALLIYRNQNQVGGSKQVKKNTKWDHIQCPRQTNNVDCGYFVLRFMREIVDDKLTKIPELFLPKNGWHTYNQNEIDEIRIELAHYILDFAR